MTRRAWRVVLTALLPACADGAAQPVTVFAAASLTEAFEELADEFQRRHGRTMRFNFAGSHQLAFQLARGAKADLFASADTRWTDRIDTLFARTAVPFAENRLVVIVPSGNPGAIASLADLARPGIRLVLAAEAAPVGEYARRMINRLADTPGFPPGYAQDVLANVASEEENVKAVAVKVRLAEADAGVVYQSDVSVSLAPHVHVLEIPDSANVVATYPIAVLARGDHPAAAEDFLSLLLSLAGRVVLERHGLQTLTTGRGERP